MRFDHPSEAQQLNGLGPKLYDCLTDLPKKFCEENGLPIPVKDKKRRKKSRLNQDEAEQEEQESPRPKKRTILANATTVARRDISER